MKKRMLYIGITCTLILICGYIVYAYKFNKNIIKTYVKDDMQCIDGSYYRFGEDELYIVQLHNWWNIWGGLEHSTTKYIENDEIVQECYRVYINLATSLSNPKVELILNYRGDDGKIHRISMDLDKSMQFYKPEEATNVQRKVLEERRDWICEIYQKMYDMWGVLEPPSKEGK